MGFEFLYEDTFRDVLRLRPHELAHAGPGMFHVTAHAMDDLHCFGDRADKLEFLDRFARILSPLPIRDPLRRAPYPHLRPEASLVAYCLLDNHYHLLIRQFSVGGCERAMRSVLTSYGHYFNRRYGRRFVPIFREPYTATQISSSVHGARAMAYVTLNHEIEREHYEFNSHDVYVGRRKADWIDTNSGLWFFGGDSAAYRRYLAGEGRQALERKIARRDQSTGKRARRIPRGPATHIKR